MDETKTARIVGKPDGWVPLTELEHFMQCPLCGKMLDCRDLSDVFAHVHEGPELKFLEG